MPASALLIGASVASLNLCTDEYLLLLARPQEIASVSFLVAGSAGIAAVAIGAALSRQSRVDRGCAGAAAGHRADDGRRRAGDAPAGPAAAISARSSSPRRLRSMTLRRICARSRRRWANRRRATPWLSRLSALRADHARRRRRTRSGCRAAASDAGGRVDRHAMAAARGPRATRRCPADAPASKRCWCGRPRCWCRASTEARRCRAGCAGSTIRSFAEPNRSD